MKLHAFAQMEPRGALVDLLPAFGKAGLEREVLAEAEQGIEGQMRELERGTCQLLVGIERGRVCVIGHAQRLAIRRGSRHDPAQYGQAERENAQQSNHEQPQPSKNWHPPTRTSSYGW